MKQGHSLSLQFHRVKEETVRVLSGRLLFETRPAGEEGDLRRIEMAPGDTIHIPPGTVHRMTGIEDCEIVEVSTPRSWTTSSGSRTATAARGPPSPSPINGGHRDTQTRRTQEGRRAPIFADPDRVGHGETAKETPPPSQGGGWVGGDLFTATPPHPYPPPDPPEGERSPRSGHEERRSERAVTPCLCAPIKGARAGLPQSGPQDRR